MSEQNNKKDTDKKVEIENKQLENSSVKGSLVSKVSLIASLVALGISCYAVADLTLKDDATNRYKQDIDSLNLGLSSLETNNTQQQQIVNALQSQADNISSQIQATRSTNQAMQTQIDTISHNLTSPMRSIYKQQNIINIQSAIDYLILAKDVMVFTNDSARANELLDLAFDKISASNIANIGASDREQIKSQIQNISTNADVINSFVSIMNQCSSLEYITPESIGKDKPVQDSNKVMEYLKSMVEIQDISSQKLVVTKQMKVYVAKSLYNALINLQTAMYVSDAKQLASSKDALIKVIKTYFVQNNQSAKLISSIESLQTQQSSNTTSKIDSLINQLTKQQDTLLSKNVDGLSVQKGK